MKIKLPTVEKVKNFVEIATKQNCDIDLVSNDNRYVINAKSIMGIFSLDLSKEIELKVHLEGMDKKAIESKFVAFED